MGFENRQVHFAGSLRKRGEVLISDFEVLITVAAAYQHLANEVDNVITLLWCVLRLRHHLPEALGERQPHVVGVAASAQLFGVERASVWQARGAVITVAAVAVKVVDFTPALPVGIGPRPNDPGVIDVLVIALLCD